ncbi:MAG: restriction endonuclease subunit S [Actinobacteria bacterium]|nr:restriction endonuclease subunit S [Actinomycetota bacterium]
MNKQEFKETEIGKIPKEWKVKKIGDLFKIKTGTTPSTKQKEYWNNGHINWITPADMGKLNGRLLIENSERKITEKGLKETNLTLMPNGSIIISTRAPVGYVVIVKGKTTFNQGCKGLIPKSIKEINPIFYTYYLLSKKSFLEHSSSGSTFKELSKKTLEDFIVPFPPLCEQKKIAEVLSTVDQAIEEVNETIAKTERLKKELMQELLIKGIGHKNFKDTKIGRIPKEWEVVRLGDYIDMYSGYAFKRQDFLSDKSNGTPIIKIGNLQKGSIIIDEETDYVSKDFYEKLPDFQLHHGDVLIALSGATTGKVSVVDKDLCLALVNQRVGKFKILSPEKVTQEFFYYLSQLDTFKKFVFRNIGQSAQGNLSPNQIKNSEILLPPLPEQKKIAEILSKVDERMKLLKEKKEKLGRVKKGLMNDLLTGRKRVKLEA